MTNPARVAFAAIVSALLIASTARAAPIDVDVGYAENLRATPTSLVPRIGGAHAVSESSGFIGADRIGTFTRFFPYRLDTRDVAFLPTGAAIDNSRPVPECSSANALSPEQPTVCPEPSGTLLLVAGLLAAGLVRLRQKRVTVESALSS